MRPGVILTFMAACSGAPTPQPVAVATRPETPAAPTCADVGVILRGEVTADDEAAGPAREQAIQAACEADHWAADVVRCAASTAHPEDCLGRLSEPQQTSYAARLKTWSDNYGMTVVEASPDPGLSCEEGLHNSDSIRPVLDDNSPERTWQSELRQRELVATCERAGWNPLTRSCLAVATTPDAADACLNAELDPAALDALHKRYDAAAAAAKTIATLKASPDKMDCKHVVDAHYADAKWQGKGKPEERKQSRSQLLLACKNERWDDFHRACMIADPRFCPLDLRWDYPALPTACSEYAIAIARVGACAALPPQTRVGLKQAFEAARLGWSNQTSSLEAACRAGADAVIAVLQSSNC